LDGGVEIRIPPAMNTTFQVPPAEHEDVEWSDIRHFDCNRRDLPRVLLIGDSIVKGYRETVRDVLSNEFLVSAFSSSRCVGDSALTTELELAVAAFPPAIVHFNNGLHGWFTNESAYEAGLRSTLGMIRRMIPEVLLLLATTTPMRVRGELAQFDGAHHQRIMARNTAMGRVSLEEGYRVNDLHALVANQPVLYDPDAIHFTGEGYGVLSCAVAGFIRDSFHQLGSPFSQPPRQLSPPPFL